MVRVLLLVWVFILGHIDQDVSEGLEEPLEL
jgi:hypothetical protein